VPSGGGPQSQGLLFPSPSTLPCPSQPSLASSSSSLHLCDTVAVMWQVGVELPLSQVQGGLKGPLFA
jgi:hypothetical protein